MFLNSKFNGDISDWDVSNVIDKSEIFDECPLENQLEKQPKFNKFNI
jgi:hypothetical protein